MNHKRMGRISQEIKKVLSHAIIYEMKDPRIAPMTSVTDVTVSSDLSYCDAYISVMGKEWDKKQTIEGLEAGVGFLKNQLATKIDLRQIPDIRFHLDESIDRGMKMDALIEEVIQKDRESQRARGDLDEEGGDHDPSDLA